MAEKAGIVFGLVAINGREFPNTLITKLTDADGVIKAVDDPAIKLIFDAYYVQIETEDGIWIERGMK